MSDGGRGRASLAVERVEVISNVDAERSAVRSIAWLDARVIMVRNFCLTMKLTMKLQDGDPKALTNRDASARQRKAADARSERYRGMKKAPRNEDTRDAGAAYDCK